MARYSRSKLTSHPIGLGPYGGAGLGIKAALKNSPYGKYRRRKKKGGSKSRGSRSRSGACKRTLAVCDVVKGGKIRNCRRIKSGRRKK